MRLGPGARLAGGLVVALSVVPHARGATEQRTAAPLTVAMHARAVQPGEVVLVTVTTPQPAETVTTRAFIHTIPAYRVDATTWRALIGIDLETATGAYPLIADATVGTRRLEATSTIDVRPKAFPTRRLAVDDAFVNPPASVTARIAEEGARLSALWTKNTPKRLWDGPFVRPVSEPANSAFGTRSVYNGQARSPHTGADFLSPAGTPVHAPAGGAVVIAEPLYYTGNTVVLDHGLGCYSLFAHLSAIDVHAGDVVAADDLLGKVGATGRVTGPHLHWAMRVNGARVDPLSVLAILGPDGK